MEKAGQSGRVRLRQILVFFLEQSAGRASLHLRAANRALALLLRSCQGRVCVRGLPAGSRKRPYPSSSAASASASTRSPRMTRSAALS